MLFYISLLLGSCLSPIHVMVFLSVVYSISGGFGRIWLDNVDCSSSHTGTLADCSHSAFGSHNCTHSEDVALVCVGGQSHACLFYTRHHNWVWEAL